MKITSLGHTECLIEFPLQNGATWRLMIDSWYSSFSPADCAERTPQVSFDWEKMPKIDVIFISHSHMDHLDPYFLTKLYQFQSPLLLLSETLAYLVPTIQEFLPIGTRIELLRHLKTRTFEGEVEITGLVYVEDKISNEDDVMTLFVAHGKNAAYFEIDMIPPMIYEEQQKLLDLFESKKFKNRIYIHSNNELEGNLKLFDFPNTKAREGWKKEYITMRKEEILERYATCVEHELPLASLWRLPGYRSLFIGQGLQYPVQLSPALAKNKIFGLAEVAGNYGNIASQFGIESVYEALYGGTSIDLRGNGTIAPAEIPGIRVGGILPADIHHEALPYRADGPLHLGVQDFEQQESAILTAIHTRFLPSKIADPNDSLKQAIILDGLHKYVIEVEYGSKKPFESRYYAWGFSRFRFERIIPANRQDLPKIQESYFANDLTDFLEGKVELYCNFIQDLNPEMNYRLWTVLGSNFLNHDLVERKYRYHFKLAKNGGTAESYVLGMFR